MRAVFSSQFKKDLDAEEIKYRAVSPKLAMRFRKRIADEVKEIIRRQGGDHVGPHGYPCRKPKPFPYYLYYSLTKDTIYVLALVHERRHPEFLKRRNKER